ncbi:hypothetical protein GUITHDRAFT_111306 [Guillardia theta CCMP2712]|uniref:Macrophage erythroblast attacher n=1 Tax=Guillardia theta (strain CCMP2712) TaxID=905079 RepID=L1J3A4_GUITC|nr:hypothetical protein GUITHDRAFT_111306 [Guillardia theta CCMP2712]EKX42624.1 hypothetical protein GUITHDRAFT_111306 [Guillardia theta CCMP2712]|eukprot:XP_005829604.1 hypothetical protein GUITHDRAFT_111306 [Guillardia theta CCMP2712]
MMLGRQELCGWRRTMPHDSHGNYVENALIKNALENMNRVAKNQQKLVTKELEMIASVLADLKKGKPSKDVAGTELSRLVGRIQVLKRKLEDVDKEEDTKLEHMEARLHLLRENQEHVDDTRCAIKENKRLDRFLADHLARFGMLETASMIIKEENLERFVDLDMYKEAAPILAALLEGDCSPGELTDDDCERLLSPIISHDLSHKMSNLEFQLRLQAFVELVRKEAVQEAVQYARKHLGPSCKENFVTIKKYMAILAFQRDTDVMSCWDLSSLLMITLQAGLTCLKTTRCVEDPEPNSGCPVCHPVLAQIAQDLPIAHHMHSTLVCSISGAIMNEHNPPMALPNGNVYSTQALMDMAASNMGQVTCPKSGDTYDFSDLRKVYIS